MIYFISDTHFGHANIVKMCERPYPDVEAMNEALITAWNERVHGDDTVYIIGDCIISNNIDCIISMYAFMEMIQSILLETCSFDALTQSLS